MNNEIFKHEGNYPGEVFFLLKSKEELLSCFPHLANCNKQNPLIVEHMELFDYRGNPVASYRSIVSCQECGVKRMGREI